MVISCFRSARGNTLTIDDDRPQPARRPTSSRNHKVSRSISRQGSDSSRISSASTCSNESISKLPPCKRKSDAELENMMMPVSTIEARPSRCLRLSHPRIYSNIVSDMKHSKGCRDWRNFAVFHDDDVDMSVTADEAAERRAIEYRKRVRELNRCLSSWPSSTSSDRSIEVDMIG